MLVCFLKYWADMLKEMKQDLLRGLEELLNRVRLA
jgi:hypothetical protein